MTARKSNTWQQALRKWNEGKDQWVIPKQGSAFHAEVKKIQKKLDKKAKKAAAKAVPEAGGAPVAATIDKKKKKKKQPVEAGEEQAIPLPIPLSSDSEDTLSD
jgi:hypothetical protein